jgi:import receptor subunit TOM20
VAFYRALRVYPAPTELLGIYQQTVAPPVFMLIVELMNHDVSQKSSSTRGGAAKEDGIDDDLNTSTPASRSASRGGPPSETSSHEWDKLTDPGPPSVA